MPVSVINPLRPIAFRAMRIGELVLDDFGEGTVLALVVSRGGGWVQYAEIDGPSIEPFTIRQVESRNRCLSYGTDWVLEARPGQATRIFPDGTKDLRAGEAYLVEGEVRLALLYKHEGNPGPVLYDVRSGKFVQDARPAACGFGWAIWASDEDFRRHGAKPIFEFEPELQNTGDSDAPPQHSAVPRLPH
jgi:hypothetical protein